MRMETRLKAQGVWSETGFGIEEWGIVVTRSRRLEERDRFHDGVGVGDRTDRDRPEGERAIIPGQRVTATEREPTSWAGTWDCR